jgi:Fe-coproporphyrin III synthase
MIGITKLYCGTVQESDVLRYKARPAQTPPHLLQFAGNPKPVVVWNCTRRCNLSCAHCYSTSGPEPAPDEMSTTEAISMIDDLGAYGCPVLLLSGGEPLLREDLPELITHARNAGLRVVISTNGTLVSSKRAKQLQKLGVSYVGVSLDGLEAVHDAFRRRRGAFAEALTGIRNCLAQDVKAGVRMTLHAQNAGQIPEIFRLVADAGIPRLCFYHLVATGRGGELSSISLSHDETRQALDVIMDQTAAMHDANQKTEVLTVANHADGPYLYLRLLRENPEQAERCLRLLRRNGGNRSGIGIACVSWNGEVYPDQFWRGHSVGNVRNRPFSEVWGAPTHPLLPALRERHAHLQGRCLTCRWLDVCNGNLRARAEAAAGDPWADDPGCYLTDAEISPADAAAQLADGSPRL